MGEHKYKLRYFKSNCTISLIVPLKISAISLTLTLNPPNLVSSRFTPNIMDEEDAPPVTLTLSLDDFAEVCQKLMALDHNDFVKFAVCGQYDNQQVVVDPVLNRMDENEGVALKRDVDSIVGICKDIVVDDAITVYPIGKHEDNLSTDVHLRHTFTNSKVSLLSSSTEATY